MAWIRTGDTALATQDANPDAFAINLFFCCTGTRYDKQKADYEKHQELRVKNTQWTRTGPATMLEINLARQDPPAYAQFLREMLPLYEGKYLLRPGQPKLKTKEGVKAVQDAISFLENLPPRAPLETLSPGLSAAAVDHMLDLSKHGTMDHKGKDGSTPFIRMNRHGKWKGLASENISFGAGDARDHLIRLIIDDGVPARGHRKALFNKAFKVVGIAEGPHPKFKQVQVQEFAQDYEELQEPEPGPEDEEVPWLPDAKNPNRVQKAIDTTGEVLNDPFKLFDLSYEAGVEAATFFEKKPEPKPEGPAPPAEWKPDPVPGVDIPRNSTVDSSIAMVNVARHRTARALLPAELLLLRSSRPMQRCRGPAKTMTSRSPSSGL